MNKKISCGGFEIDNETIKEENGVLKAVGGGSGDGVLVVHAIENEAMTEVVLDKTWQEIYDAEVAIIVTSIGVTSDVSCLYSIYRNPFGTAYTVDVFTGYFEGDSVSLVRSSYSASSANGYPKYIYE